MSQPTPLKRVTGAIAADRVETIPARDAFTSASGKTYDAKPASTIRQAHVLVPAAFEGSYTDQLQAVLTVRIPDDHPALAAGEVVDWYCSEFALTKPGVNGRSPYPVVATSYVCDIESEAATTKRSRTAA